MEMLPGISISNLFCIMCIKWDENFIIGDMDGSEREKEKYCQVRHFVMAYSPGYSP